MTPFDISAITWTSLAIILPWWMGANWLRLWFPAAGNSALVWGYGFFLGIFSTFIILRGYAATGVALSTTAPYLTLILLTLIPIWLTKRNPATVNRSESIPQERTPLLTKVVIVLLLAYLTIRTTTLASEIILRPIYPWDAWMNWSPKAKVWFELGRIVPFVSPEEWISGVEPDAYTLGNRSANHYPELIPTLQLWIALSIGEWIDGAVNTPWLFCYIAFGLAFYGQLVTGEVSRVLALFATSLLLTTPYINTHVALAGYADLWLSAAFTLGGAALINWERSRNPSQLYIVILMILFCISTKIPGYVLAGILVTTYLLNNLGTRITIYASALAILLIVLFVFTEGIHIPLRELPDIIVSTKTISLPLIGFFELAYHPVGDAFITNILVYPNWHMFGYIFILLIPLAIFHSVRVGRLSGLLLSTFCALFLYMVFFWTRHYHAAENYTTLNRAVLYLVPILWYFTCSTLFTSQASEGSSGTFSGTSNSSESIIHPT